MIHPQSIIHSMVEFCDGSVIAQMGMPDMKVPIQYALTFPDRNPLKVQPLNLPNIGNLTFKKPDMEKFPALRLGYQAAREGGTMGAILNAANEVAVQAFLDGKIRFTDIVLSVEKVINNHHFIKNPCLEDILMADAWARQETKNALCKRINQCHTCNPGYRLLIFIHELGHFLVAKKIGVRVLAFSLGFGHAAIFKRNGEKPSIVFLYFRLEAMSSWLEKVQMKKRQAPRGNFRLRVQDNASVLVAGVALNAILAFIAFIVAFQIGVPFITSEVGQVMPGWPAWESGIKRGDKIVEIDGSKDVDFEDLFTIVALSNPAKGVQLKIERDNKAFDVNVLPKYDEEHGIQRIGIMPATSLEIDKIFAYENNDSPARDAGIQVKDIVVAVNGKRISTEDEFREVEAANTGKEISITVLRDNKEAELKAIPSKSTRYMLGISCATAILDGVKNNSLASSVGLIKGDEIIEVNSNPVAGFTDIKKRIIDSKDETCILTVKRNDKISLLEVPLKDTKAREEFLDGLTPFYGLKD